MWKKIVGWSLLTWAVSNVIGLILFWDVPPGPGWNLVSIGLTFGLFFGWYRLVLRKVV